ncbi:hydrogenase maturation nickel metallochaperone HypA [candidate division KSB1 bacterium]|nr:hydrogenase maturation nickel metallochaperone HypA [candidate division KSB1 bacterium]NIR70902.1 hydrogenase maturation nickel metallochaperone HypA [candidate division KSB1 bacterium]NIS24672.1 hydrogenase maturation nickel metallochaperone HypA [candidate division KSB1 bacterium]NIT71574.1 hydrogenase maturation nickel metallochaperone HypA [candidate division KSB1 bacterium]NIU25272.1 hydrogenase maturation nickel metallochaperone HypA [candidate division KSB1 bacterium]
MHELTIANSIVSTVMEEIDRRDLPPVERIVVRIGALSDVVPEALQFNFEVITNDTVLANTELEIEHVPLEGTCRMCHHDFAVDDFMFTCPSCHSTDIRVTQGEELDIAYLEVADGSDDERSA